MLTRREIMSAAALVGSGGLLERVAEAAVQSGATAGTPAWAAPEFDVPKPELVLELVVTCSRPETIRIEGDHARVDDGEVAPVSGAWNDLPRRAA